LLVDAFSVLAAWHCCNMVELVDLKPEIDRKATQPHNNAPSLTLLCSNSYTVAQILENGMKQ
jgi:hypothetical protein